MCMCVIVTHYQKVRFFRCFGINIELHLWPYLPKNQSLEQPQNTTQVQEYPARVDP